MLVFNKCFDKSCQFVEISLVKFWVVCFLPATSLVTALHCKLFKELDIRLGIDLNIKNKFALSAMRFWFLLFSCLIYKFSYSCVSLFKKI